MLSGPAEALSPYEGRVFAMLTEGIVGGDDVPSKPVYPGIDRMAAIAAGLNDP
jgi:hypothetical protein